MTDKEVAATLALVQAAYPQMQISRETAQVWAYMLHNEDGGSVRRAVEDHIRESRFFPAISEVLERTQRMRVAALDEQYRLAERAAWEKAPHDPERVVEMSRKILKRLAS